MGKTSIEWTDATWNPTTGCSKVSPGCKNCYAERDWARLSKNPKTVYYGRSFNDVATHSERLDQPIHWKRPRRIFVNSMSDLFHSSIPDDFIDQVFAVMVLASKHHFQVLTKRPERMRDYVISRSPKQKPHNMGFYICERAKTDSYEIEWPLPNVWLGVSVEDQKRAEERIPLLLQTPAAIRFLSCEPLLGMLDLTNPGMGLNCESCLDRKVHWCVDPVIHWVIAGGESGPAARPTHPDWVRNLRNQCQESQVPFFFKQWGKYEAVTPLYCGRDDEAENGRGDLVAVSSTGYIYNEFDGQPSDPDTWLMERVGGRKTDNRLLDGKIWDQIPGINYWEAQA